MEDSGDRRTEGKRREFKVLGDLDEDWYMGIRAQGTWKKIRFCSQNFKISVMAQFQIMTEVQDVVFEMYG